MFEWTIEILESHFGEGHDEEVEEAIKILEREGEKNDNWMRYFRMLL